ncbi:YrhK family protein [Salibacterium halotolerans]|uniref:YrhK-like protein n=1 Tax=Salibacterium halotolerans TaxID=1884432 RepID=A0A1I5LFU9_9BACI|nr:YrhK family protein [Salibacterium halotolerans]SFO96244.1 YrhK-like protein [Salibacterium halotolerans]
MSRKQSQEDYVDISLGRYEFFFQKKYTVLNTLNDFLLGLEFLIGSIFFFFEPFKNAGIWLFVIGSLQLIIRPTIRLVHDFHLKKHVEERKKKEGS